MTRSQPDRRDSRVRELARASAQAAARAFGQLCAQRVRVEEVRVCIGSGSAAAGKFETGVLFEMEGDANGVVALLLSCEARDAVLERLGAEPPGDSALREVGNIVASHSVSAVADRLCGRVTLSVPTLVREDAGHVLDRLLSRATQSIVTTTGLCGAGDGPDAVLVLAVEAP